MEFVIVTSPFMFYLPIAGSLHAAASDLFVSFLVVTLLITPTRRVPRGSTIPFVGYAVTVMVVAVCSAAYAEFSPLPYDAMLGLANLFKLVVTLAYSIIVFSWVARSPIHETMRALRVWGWIAGLLAAGSVATEFGGLPLIPSDGYRSYGFFQDPNLYAGYLLVSLMVVLAREGYSRTTETGLLVFVLSAGVFATASRSGLATLAALLALSFFLVNIPRVRKALLPAGLAALVIGLGALVGNTLLLAFPSLSRLASSSQQVDDDPRLALWGRAIDLWKDNPIFGIGIGQYGRYSGDVLGVAERTGAGYIAHNTFLSFLAELGILGFLLCAGGLWALSTSIRRIDLPRPSLAALQLGVVAIAAQMMTLNLQNLRYVWIFVGISLGLRARTRADKHGDFDVTAPTTSVTQ